MVSTDTPHEIHNSNEFSSTSFIIDNGQTAFQEFASTKSNKSGIKSIEFQIAVLQISGVWPKVISNCLTRILISGAV